MRIIKNLASILILVIMSFYTYQQFEKIPASVINGLIFLPYALVILVVGLAIRFNRSLIFFYTLLITVSFATLKFGWATSDLAYALLSSFIPILIIILSALPERGIFSEKSLPSYTVLLLSAGFAVSLLVDQPDWAQKFFLSDWAPERYFDWTSLNQTTLLISVFSVITLFVHFLFKPSPNRSAGLGVLIMLIAQYHAGDTSKSLLIFTSATLLMCLYAIMQESWRMAYLDELTGLPGRRALREKFQNLSGEYAVAMLDVDHFKKFNDTYGHDTGDAVLRMIAGKLDNAGGGGMSYRYGGEEFSIVFTGKTIAQAKEHLEALRENIADSAFVINRENRRTNVKTTKPVKKKTVQVTISIGVSDSTKNSASPWDVLKLADKALYRAKKKGRNCVVG